MLQLATIDKKWQGKEPKKRITKSQQKLIYFQGGMLGAFPS